MSKMPFIITLTLVFIMLSPGAFAQSDQWLEEAVTIDQSNLEPLTKEQIKNLEEVSPLLVEICKNQRVPSGYVIVGENYHPNCPGRVYNAWVIKRPGVTEEVCKVSPIPSNYRKQGEFFDPNCPGRAPNTWRIRRI